MVHSRKIDVVIHFSSQYIFIFPLFQIHWHTLPYPKTVKKLKLPDLKKTTTYTSLRRTPGSDSGIIIVSLKNFAFWHNQNYCILLTFQLHQENRKKGKKREKSVDEDDEEVKRDKLKKVGNSYITLDQNCNL